MLPALLRTAASYSTVLLVFPWLCGQLDANQPTNLCTSIPRQHIPQVANAASVYVQRPGLARKFKAEVLAEGKVRNRAWEVWLLLRVYCWHQMEGRWETQG